MLDPNRIEIARMIVAILAALLVAWFLTMFLYYALTAWAARRFMVVRVRAYRRPSQRRYR